MDTQTRKVFVLGATGPAGKWTLKKLVAKGYQVTAMTRNLEKLKREDYPAVNWVEGDPYDAQSLKNIFQGHDAVVSCIGSGGSLKKTEVYSQSLKNSVEAMEATGIKRLMFVTAAQDVDHVGFFFRNVVRKLILNNLFYDMLIAEEFIKNYKGNVEYTIVRPFRFLEQPSNGNCKAVKKDEITSSKGWDFKTRVEDIGIFLSEELFSDNWVNEFVCLGQ
jgi:putative NADH-flavin reductase